MREAISAFFAPPECCDAAGLFGIAHLLLLLLTAAAVAVALVLSRSMCVGRVRRLLRYAFVFFLVAEGVKLAVVWGVFRLRSPNELPLYFCSLVLYATPLAAFGRSVWQRAGDAFLAFGGLVGGAVYLVFPTTSLLRYPAWHFISFHGFLWHGVMLYLALLLLWRGGYIPEHGDLRYFAASVSVGCAVAFVFNTVYNCFVSDPVANLMFLSKDFPGTPLSLIYRLCGPFFTPVMWLVQATGPFLLGFGGVLLLRRSR